MATTEAAAMGQRIAEARGRASLTQAELAVAVSIDRSALAKIESGTRRVSALELARIADAVGERIEWFVEDAPAAIVSRRDVREHGMASPTLDRLVERIARHVEFVVNHDDGLHLESPDLLETPTSANAAEDAAAMARSLLAVDDVEPVIDLSRQVAACGLFAFTVDMGENAADGASILLSAGGVAVVNGHLRVGRRRLTLAHELGHYLCADEFTVDWRVADREDADQREQRLDRFARAVLLPARGIQRTWQNRRATDDLRTTAVKVASEYRVDMSTLARRLVELGIVDQAESEFIRKVRTTKADIVEFDLFVHDELAPPELPRRYIESVLRLYRREIISAARTIDLLLDTWEEADLPQLGSLPEAAIWKFVS